MAFDSNVRLNACLTYGFDCTKRCMYIVYTNDLETVAPHIKFPFFVVIVILFSFGLVFTTKGCSSANEINK